MLEGNWDAKKQAEYYDRFFNICFSHPAVEAINIMGIGDTTWRPGNARCRRESATPAFSKLKELITERWRTRISDKSPRVTRSGSAGSRAHI